MLHLIDELNLTCPESTEWTVKELLLVTGLFISS